MVLERAYTIRYGPVGEGGDYVGANNTADENGGAIKKLDEDLSRLFNAMINTVSKSSNSSSKYTTEQGVITWTEDSHLPDLLMFGGM